MSSSMKMLVTSTFCVTSGPGGTMPYTKLRKQNRSRQASSVAASQTSRATNRLGHVAAGATVLGLMTEAVRKVEPAIPLLQSLLQVAPWVVGAAALAGIAYMIWARIDDRRRGLR